MKRVGVVSDVGVVLAKGDLEIIAGLIRQQHPVDLDGRFIGKVGGNQQLPQNTYVVGDAGVGKQIEIPNSKRIGGAGVASRGDLREPGAAKLKVAESLQLQRPE